MRLLSQLVETVGDFNSGVFDINTQNEMKYLGQMRMLILAAQTESISQISMQTLEKSSAEKMGCEVHNIVATVKARLHDAIWFTRDILVIPRIEFDINSASTSLTRYPSSIVLSLDQRDFSGTQMAYEWPL